MEIFLLIVRLLIAAIFLLAGIGKLLDLKGSEKAVKDFGVPDILAKPVSIILPVLEILIALTLLFNETSWFGAIGASLLLLTFIGGMLYQLKLGTRRIAIVSGRFTPNRSAKKFDTQWNFRVFGNFLSF